MPDPIAERLTELSSFSKTALCGLWKQLFNASPDPKLRKDLMIPILGYRMQEQAFGSLNSNVRSRLSKLAVSLETEPNSTISPAPAIKPGTRLVRQWSDQVHLVNVEAKGYEYRGIRYQSLSEIARLITGTRWSGPLFFGIKASPTKKSKEVA